MPDDTGLRFGSTTRSTWPGSGTCATARGSISGSSFMTCGMFGTLAVQVWPLIDVQAYIWATPTHSDDDDYAHHVPKIDAAMRLSRLVGAAATAAPGASEAGFAAPQHRGDCDAEDPIPRTPARSQALHQ